MEKARGTLNRLLNVPSASLDDARQRRLLNILLLGMVALTLLVLLPMAFAVATGLVPQPRNTRLLYLSIPAVLCSATAIFVINRFWSRKLAAFLLLFLLMSIVFADNLVEVTLGGSLIAFTIPVVMASVLFRPYASFIVAVLASLAVVAIGVGVSGVVNVPAIMTLFLVALVSWLAARSLERALADLRTINRELDQRIVERTRDLQQRSVQLQAASEVARDATAILDIEKLLDETVHLISERLGFYHAGVFLIDERRERAVLRAASSEAGQRMLKRGHKLAVGKLGIVSHVADSGERLVVLDVGKSASHYINPDLPDTRSEMALPLISRGRVIGVLDVQSTDRAMFTEDDVATLQTMADQLANAIENARLYEDAKRRVEELTALHSIDVAMTSTLDLDEVLQTIYEQVKEVMGIASFYIALYDGRKDEIHVNLMVDQGEYLQPFKSEVEGDSRFARRVIRTRQPLWIDDVEKERDELPVECAPVGGPMRSFMVLPLVVRDQVIGVISAQSPEPCAFDEDDRRLFSNIAHQAAIAIMNAQLYEEARRRLGEAMLVQEVMLAAVSTLDFDLVLERTVKALHRALGIKRLGFMLPDEENGVLVFQPSLASLDEERTSYHIPIEGSLVGRVYRTGYPMLVRDVMEEPGYFEESSEVRSVLAVPVRVGDRIVAVLRAEGLREGAFGEDEFRIFTTVAGQLGMVLDNARLYQRLETQAAELSGAYNELEEISRLRTQLVQNVSHELRTPLSLIKGYVGLLLEGDLGRVLESQRAALQIISERTATLSRLIHNLTMLQAVPREALALAPISIVEVVQRALAEFRRSAEEAGIVFHEELPVGLPPVLGDPERLGLVLGHLVENAIKFSPGGGTVALRAWADQEKVHVSITDEGIGIAPEHLTRIFDRFYQANGSIRRRFGGMGIGLALVWEIVEAHGGTVGVESEPGKGSTFTIVLPQVKAA